MSTVLYRTVDFCTIAAWASECPMSTSNLAYSSRPLSAHQPTAIEECYAVGPSLDYCVVGVMFNLKDVRQVFLEWL